MKKNFMFTIAVLLIFANISVTAQEVPENQYGLKVVNEIELYKELVDADSSKKLVDLEKHIPEVDIDIRYATENNFMNTQLYNSPKAYLRLPAANALQEVQKWLNEQGLGLKILDAYRPYSVTLKIWEAVKDPQYAAPPESGSRHNRGCAVDVSIINLETGKEIDMPTEYDDFSEKASHTYMHLTKEQLKNREMLRSIMSVNGFSSINSEWWHYDYKGWENYHLMDLSIDELNEMQHDCCEKKPCKEKAKKEVK